MIENHADRLYRNLKDYVTIDERLFHQSTRTDERLRNLIISSNPVRPGRLAVSTERITFSLTKCISRLSRSIPPAHLSVIET
jgi:hypothetical protein